VVSRRPPLRGESAFFFFFSEKKRGLQSRPAVRAQRKRSPDHPSIAFVVFTT